jgi:myo-inositol-1(or 4)-monophosphatase
VSAGWDTDALLALALDTAREAGALATEYRSRLGAGLSWTTKSSATDVVTEGDEASERLVVERLLAARPDDGLLGEEGASRDGSSGLRWVIDPIDGTTNYLYNLPGWAVSIAVEDAPGESVVGVVHVPTLGETYWAVRGGGAYLDGVRLQVGDGPTLDLALVGTGFNYDPARRARQGDHMATLMRNVRDLRRMGAGSVDLCSVASGRLDAYYEQGLSPWDMAAGGLVAAEAGAVVGGLRGAAPGKPMIVAAAPAVWGPLVALLESIDADADPG